jgi:hypothetical protein
MADPKSTPLSLNCTLPVGVPAADVTVAVKVTLCPALEGLADEVTAVVVAAFAMLKVRGTEGAAL